MITFTNSFQKSSSSYFQVCTTAAPAIHISPLFLHHVSRIIVTMHRSYLSPSAILLDKVHSWHKSSSSQRRFLLCFVAIRHPLNVFWLVGLHFSHLHSGSLFVSPVLSCPVTGSKLLFSHPKCHLWQQLFQSRAWVSYFFGELHKNLWADGGSSRDRLELPSHLGRSYAQSLSDSALPVNGKSLSY